MLHEPNDPKHVCDMINEKYEAIEKTINNINIEVFDHGCFTGGREWNHQNISSPFCRLYLVTDGCGIVNINGRSYDLLPDKAYIIPPNIIFDVYTNDHIKKFYLHFSAQLIPGNDIFDGTKSCLILDWDNLLVGELIQYAQSSALKDIFKFKALLFEIISLFISYIDYDIKDKVQILYKYEDVHKYIKENLKFGICAKSVAKALNISSSSLIKNYRADTGSTLNSYIKNMILRASIEKLLFTDLNIKEIATAFEFCDEFYFSRFFKKHTRYSPKAYRKNNRV